MIPALSHRLTVTALLPIAIANAFVENQWVPSSAGVVLNPVATPAGYLSYDKLTRAPLGVAPVPAGSLVSFIATPGSVSTSPAWVDQSPPGSRPGDDGPENPS
jgi:hypothetical protein